MIRIALLALAIALAGCAGKSHRSPAVAGPVDVEVAINTSSSSAELINQSLVASASLGHEASRGSLVTWHRLNVDSQEVRTFTAPFSVGAALKQLRTHFPPSRDYGTRLDVYLGRALRKNHPAHRFYAIVVYGDGFAETTNPALLQLLGAKLARQPSFLGIVFVGAKPGSIEFLRANLAPIGSRLRFIALADPIPFSDLPAGGSK
jgi:hypothetical protein